MYEAILEICKSCMNQFCFIFLVKILIKMYVVECLFDKIRIQTNFWEILW